MEKGGCFPAKTEIIASLTHLFAKYWVISRRQISGAKREKLAHLGHKFPNSIYFTYPIGKEPMENVWKVRFSKEAGYGNEIQNTMKDQDKGLNWSLARCVCVCEISVLKLQPLSHIAMLISNATVGFKCKAG